MSSEVDICNLALSHIGDTANIASINPPEESVQAEHCARFYPIARDTLLEMHTWGFATRSISLALLDLTAREWLYVYQRPVNALRLISVLASEENDESIQAFQEETINGTPVILTNQEDAVLRYTVLVTDTTKFSPLFVTTLSWFLASMLAGPIIKGDTGAAEAKRCLSMANTFLSTAKASDSRNRNIKPTHSVPWMAGR